MILILKKGAKKEYMEELMNKLSEVIHSKAIDTYKFCGKIKLKEDALIIQKERRGEWKIKSFIDSKS